MQIVEGSVDSSDHKFHPIPSSTYAHHTIDKELLFQIPFSFSQTQIPYHIIMLIQR